MNLSRVAKSSFRVTKVAFVLTIATAWLVMPLMAGAGRIMDGPIANFAVAIVAAVALEATDFEVDSGTLWRFGGVAFLVGAVVHLFAGTGANSGEASVPVVVGVWVVSVAVATASASERSPVAVVRKFVRETFEKFTS